MGNRSVNVPAEPDKVLDEVIAQIENEICATGLSQVRDACERIRARIPAATIDSYRDRVLAAAERVLAD